MKTGLTLNGKQLKEICPSLDLKMVEGFIIRDLKDESEIELFDVFGMGLAYRAMHDSLKEESNYITMIAEWGKKPVAFSMYCKGKTLIRKRLLLVYRYLGVHPAYRAKKYKKGYGIGTAFIFYSVLLAHHLKVDKIKLVLPHEIIWNICKNKLGWKVRYSRKIALNDIFIRMKGKIDFEKLEEYVPVK